jgi:hypothetical protein
LEKECKDLEDELMRFPEAPHDDVSDAAAYQSDIARPAVIERPREPRSEPVVNTPYGKIKSAYEDEEAEVGPQFPDIGI